MTTQPWHPGAYRPDPAYPPHYSTMPEYLRIEDAVRPTLDGKRQSFWTRCRDSGLAEWAPLGIELRVRDAIKPYGPNRVTINVETLDLASMGQVSAWHCFEVCAPCSTSGCDWIHFNPTNLEQAFAARNSQWIRYRLAHEFGHSLGFGHGGDGIMDEMPLHAVVNDEEIAAAQAYWGTT